MEERKDERYLSQGGTRVKRISGEQDSYFIKL